MCPSFSEHSGNWRDWNEPNSTRVECFKYGNTVDHSRLSHERCLLCEFQFQWTIPTYNRAWWWAFIGCLAMGKRWVGFVIAVNFTIKQSSTFWKRKEATSPHNQRETRYVCELLCSLRYFPSYRPLVNLVFSSRKQSCVRSWQFQENIRCGISPGLGHSFRLMRCQARDVLERGWGQFGWKERSYIHSWSGY